jgi:hypothetical protein
MILILAIVLFVSFICTGFIIIQPRWFSQLISRKYYCDYCHKELETRENFIAGFLSDEDRSSRNI